MGSGAEIFNAVINQGGTPAMLSNTLALRPAFGYRGRIFIATDTREIYRDTGTSWELIGSGGGSVNIYNSDGTLTGNRIVTANNLSLDILGQGSVNSVRFQAAATDTMRQFIRSNTFPQLHIQNNASGFGADDGFVLQVSSTAGAFIQTRWNANISIRNNNTNTAVFTNNNRFLLGTTTDAGFLADINGTSVFRNNMFVYATNGVRITNASGDNNTGGWLYTIGGGGGSLSMAANIDSSGIIPNIGARSSRLTQRGSSLQFLVNQTPGSTSLNFGFDYTPITESTGGSQILFNVNPLLLPTTGNATFNVLRLQPTYNFTGSYSGGPLIGFRYNPVLTSLTGVSQHIAIQTDSGIVDHYDRLDLTTSDFSSRNAWTLHARLRQTLTAGADQFGAGYYVGGLHIREISASGANTYGNATINAGGASSLQIDFTGAGTLTASQSGLRAFSGHQIFNTFGGTASGTITHFAGMQILGLYNRNSGSITPTITNAFGLIVNNLNDYSHTFTLTNRWGVYQTGGSDNNYFAGKLLVGTTTVTARQVHISGNVELTTTLAGTAGGSSGQHLSVWVNGNEYKIALLNP